MLIHLINEQVYLDDDLGVMHLVDFRAFTAFMKIAVWTIMYEYQLATHEHLLSLPMQPPMIIHLD